MSERDIRSLDLGLLRTFDALMRERSVSRAATRLFVSQPAVSASLNRLREVFDDPLFARNAHGITPTARALALAPRVERVLADVAVLLDAERSFDPAYSQRIFRIAGGDHTSHLALPRLSTELAAVQSRIRLFWKPLEFATAAAQLRKGDIDLAILPRPAPPRDMEYLPLYEDGYVAVVRADHPAAGSALTLDAFCDLRQVFFGYGTSALDDLVDDTLRRMRRERQTQVAVTSFSQMADLLSQTDLLGIMPARIARRYAPLVKACTLPFELPGYQMYVCWDRRAHEDPGVQWLAGRIQQIVAQPA